MPKPVDDLVFNDFDKNCESAGSGTAGCCCMVNSCGDPGDGGEFERVVLGEGVPDDRRMEMRRVVGGPCNIVSDPPAPCVNPPVSRPFDDVSCELERRKKELKPRLMLDSREEVGRPCAGPSCCEFKVVDEPALLGIEELGGGVGTVLRSNGGFEMAAGKDVGP
jgi:hypothetical protein